MNPSYQDILDATDIPPIWWDGNGTPRFAAFHPNMQGIYDHYAVLAEIACQDCSERFFVADGYPQLREGDVFEESVKNYHYGDPPQHGCIGDTMNCIDLRLVEVWTRGVNDPFGGWTLLRELKDFDIRQDWAKGIGYDQK
jgi:hypothetical protein